MPEDLDEYHGEQVLVRPVPTDVAERAAERFHRTGQRHRGQISDSWWEKGGLLHDDRGPALLDAEGERIPLGPFPTSSLLVHVHRLRHNTIPSFDYLNVVGPPPAYQNLVRLPRSAGLENALGLIAWWEASGLEEKYVVAGFEKVPGQGQFVQEFGHWVVQDREQREWEARQPRGLRRLIPPRFRRHLSRSSDAAPH